MNGPQHYREAEGWIKGFTEGAWDTKAANRDALMAAQVHATLALAAATIDAHVDGGLDQWAEVLP